MLRGISSCGNSIDDQEVYIPSGDPQGEHCVYVGWLRMFCIRASPGTAVHSITINSLRKSGSVGSATGSGDCAANNFLDAFAH
jgi:hypothetical protein